MRRFVPFPVRWALDFFQPEAVEIVNCIILVLFPFFAMFTDDMRFTSRGYVLLAVGFVIGAFCGAGVLCRWSRGVRGDLMLAAGGFWYLTLWAWWHRFGIYPLEPFAIGLGVGSVIAAAKEWNAL